jgi:hypothetical protein
MDAKDSISPGWESIPGFLKKVYKFGVLHGNFSKMQGNSFASRVVYFLW